MNQKTFNSLIVGIPLAILILVFAFVPETRFVGEGLLKGILWVLNLLGAIAVVVLALGGPVALAVFSRIFVERKDSKVEENVQIPWYAHMAPAVFGGLVIGLIWMFVIRFLVWLPSWIGALYLKLGWMSGLNEVLPWGWLLYAAIAWVIGYFFAGERSREWANEIWDNW